MKARREAGALFLEAAKRAVRADPDLAEAQTAVGRVYFWLEWDWSAAEAAFRRAIVLNGSYAQAHLMLGHVLSQTLRHQEAVAALRRARELDPLNPMSHAVSAVVSFQARDYSEALGHAERATVIGPGFWIGHALQATAYEQLGRRDAALDAIVRAGRLSGGSHMAIAARGHVLATMGREREAREVLRTLEHGSAERYVPRLGWRSCMRVSASARGPSSGLRGHLPSRMCISYPYLLIRGGIAYRDDPRFVDLVARCGFFRRAVR